MIKASGGDGIPAELFQILKDDAVKVRTQYASKFGKLSSGHRTIKVFIPISNKGNAKEYSNYCTVELISHASKVELKILQMRLQQYMNQELIDYKVCFKEAEERSNF